jgi:hypothetical protein
MSTKDTLKLLKIQQIISNILGSVTFNKGWLSMVFLSQNCSHMAQLLEIPLLTSQNSMDSIRLMLL